MHASTLRPRCFPTAHSDDWLASRPASERSAVLDWLVAGACFSEDAAMNRETLSSLKGTDMESSIESLATRGAEAARRFSLETTTKP